ncbi:GNAT family N-acetyltransferase [Phenylobacterium sp.]|uniref:GNAT family N-acetyltransferase n=1 Tax=Phenylobacterium sp. TaxID=1871053 RepID=UPI0035B2C2B2
MEIVDYRPEHARAFHDLNLAWISKLFEVEAKDLEVIEDPEGKIIAKGGKIFMAVDGGRAVGCVAMIAMADGGYEVAKMTVDESLRGAGLGRLLMQRCIDEADALGAPRLYLETNSSLGPALGLYRAMGFRELVGDERPASPYARCDVWMERRA